VRVSSSIVLLEGYVTIFFLCLKHGNTLHSLWALPYKIIGNAGSIMLAVGSWEVHWISCMFEFGTAPNHRREQVELCPVNCTLGLAQPQLQKWARCSTAVFPLMFTFREKLSQVPPVPENYNVTSPPPRTASLPCVATVHNKLTGGGEGWCVSIRAHSLPGPSFMHVWSSVCCLFCISRHLS
jgi:hypothetical protein